MDAAGIAVGISLFLLAFVTLLLSVIVMRKYRGGLNSYLWWGSGIFLGFVTIVQETFIYFGYWSQLLIQSYIFMVALLVALLSIGSVNLMKSGWVRATWLGYMILMTIATAYFAFTTTVSQSVVTKGVILGALPIYDIIFSTLVTAPAATAVIVLALYSTYKTKKLGTLFIAAGGIVISIAGTLFILRSFPVTLYYSEFVGVFLLFIGFIEFPVRNSARLRAAAAAVAGQGKGME